MTTRDIFKANTPEFWQILGTAVSVLISLSAGNNITAIASLVGGFIGLQLLRILISGTQSQRITLAWIITGIYVIIPLVIFGLTVLTTENESQ